jgi:hypothetical protein
VLLIRLAAYDHFTGLSICAVAPNAISKPINIKNDFFILISSNYIMRYTIIGDKPVSASQ